MVQKYIIGDWVMLNGRKVFIRESYTDADNTFVYIVNDEECKASELKGIPLTSETLEKNGWKPTKESLGHSFKNEKHPRFALWSINDKWNFTIDGVTVCNSLSRLCYVHQVQHLLFGLGLNSDMEV